MLKCSNSIPFFSCCKAEHLSQRNRLWVGVGYEIWYDKTIILCQFSLSFSLLGREGWLCKLDPVAYLLRYWNVEISFIQGGIRFVSCFGVGRIYRTEWVAGLKEIGGRKNISFWLKFLCCKKWVSRGIVVGIDQEEEWSLWTATRVWAQW